MALCEKRVEGQIMSYPCTLDAGHERNGPEEDPEPCMTGEVERSVRIHRYWENREEARHTRPETLEDIMADAFEQYEVAEPEHNLQAADCMMRPFDGPEVAPGSEEVCPTCSGAKRPAVLVENDEAIRAGDIHNPFDVQCSKRMGDEMSLAGERCYICDPLPVLHTAAAEPEEPQFLSVEPPTIPVTDTPEVREQFNEAIDRDALKQALSEEEPRLAVCQNPTCTETEVHGHNDGGWPVLPRPTKQREGDQVLPAGGDRPVQDWMIQREHERYMEGFKTETLPDAEPGATVIRSMTESKRVGIERYGQPLHTFDGRLNIRDLADELRDAFVYISKMQMTAEADKATLVRMVADALDGVQQSWNPAEMTTDRIAEVAVERILDWVLIQRIGPEQVMPIRKPQADEEWMGT